jgi:hypothetical protein
MLDALGIGFRGFGRDAERAKHVNHEPVPHPRPVGQSVAFFGEEHPAVGTRRARALEPRDGLDRGRMGDAEPARNIGRPRLALALEQVRDQFE